MSKESKSVTFPSWCQQVMLDLCAAFDTVDHGVLTDELYRNASVYTASHSFGRVTPCHTERISNRQRLLRTGSTSIRVHAASLGGSVIGPLEFVIYTEDLGDTIDPLPATIVSSLTSLSSRATRKCLRESSMDRTLVSP